GDHAEILVRYRRLGIPTRDVQAASPDLLAQDAAALPAEEFPGLHVESTNEDESIFMGEVPRVSPAAGIGATTGELMPIMEQPGVSSFSTRADSDLMFAVAQPSINKKEETDEPFLVQKESGPLNEDLLVHLNASDLDRDPAAEEPPGIAPPLAAADAVTPLPMPQRIALQTASSGSAKSGRLAPAPTSGRLAPAPKPSVTADLIASLVSGLDATLGELGIGEEGEASTAAPYTPSLAESIARPESIVTPSEAV